MLLGIKGFNPSLLEACSNIDELKQLHSYIIKKGLTSNRNYVCKILTFCALSDSGSLNYAQLIFNNFKRPNTFMWNTMIRGYSRSNESEQTLIFYQKMLCEGVPSNSFTFPFLLKACANLSAWEETAQVHGQIVKNGFYLDLYASNSLIHVYAAFGRITLARQIFDRIVVKDTVSWNSIIDGYAKNGEINLARDMFDQMPTKNIISWTSMISGFVECGQFKEALSIFREMQFSKIEPDATALVSAISACAQLGSLDQGRWVHSYIKRYNIPIDQTLGCVLVDMYGKCGEVEEAFDVFKKMKKRGVSAWTAMIMANAINGRGRDALDLFEEMKRARITPNEITFTGVLTACSYGGFVEEGKAIFEEMNAGYDVKPSIEHYGCMVDLLGRAGKLQEAEELIKKMAMKPSAAVWGALLDACHRHKNFALGKRVGKKLIESDPDHGGRYVRLASIFAREGKWDKVVMVRKLMKDRGISKLPGCSLISINGTIHEFLAGDRWHPQTEEIYNTWSQILERIRQEGYIPGTDNLLLDLDEEEKEDAIYQHSEKLAISFGLINTEPGAKIQIVKNLRVCEDCHNATKIISKIYGREIVLRDRTQFHHFKQGECSCGDYW